MFFAEKSFMSKQINYSDEPIKIGQIADILPSLSQLASMAQTERATLTLTRSTLSFFKKTAKENNVPYTALIRIALDEYAKRHQ
jgi:predicted DNA binding CopG/RHH family protein